MSSDGARKNERSGGRSALRVQLAWAVAWVVTGLGLELADFWSRPVASDVWRITTVAWTSAAAWAVCGGLTARELARSLEPQEHVRLWLCGLVGAVAYAATFVLSAYAFGCGQRDTPACVHGHFLATGVAAGILGAYVTSAVRPRGRRTHQRSRIGKAAFKWGLSFLIFEYAAIALILVSSQRIKHLVQLLFQSDSGFLIAIGLSYGLGGFFGSGIGYRASRT